MAKAEAVEPAEPIWVLVANVKRERLVAGEGGDGGTVSTNGTRAFPPGRKVYVSQLISGDGWTRINCYGMNRHGRFVNCRIARDRLENFRAKQEYSPATIAKLRQFAEQPFYGNFEFEDQQSGEDYARIGNTREMLMGVEVVIKAYDSTYKRSVY